MEDLDGLLRKLSPKTTRPTNSPTSFGVEDGYRSSRAITRPADDDVIRPSGPPPLPPRPQGPGGGNHCPICGGTGFILKDVPLGHPDFGKAIPCKCKEEERQWRRLNAFQSMSNLEAMARFTFDNFIAEPSWLPLQTQQVLRRAHESARHYAAMPEGWLLLTGTYGCGKTHLAAAIANQRVDQGQPAVFVVMPDLLDHLRSAFGPSSEVTYDRLFEQVRETKLLVLDDLGTQSSTPWAQEKLFQLLNHRYNGQLPTVITTNQRLEDMDQRIRSRLMDINLVERIHITAPDFRSGANPSQGELSTLSLHHAQHFHSFELNRRNLSADELSNLRRVRDAALSFAEEPLGWLVLMGTHGVGKTHLAAAIANLQREQGRNDAMFVVVPDFLDYLRGAFNPQSPIPYDRRFDEVKKAPLLVFDDLGTESATPWAKEKLFQLLNYRYSANLPTVITTSAEPGEIEPWLRTRMFDVDRCQVWALKVASYRGGADQQARRKGRN
jgi:DNA replication protein DnaC